MRDLALIVAMAVLFLVGTASAKGHSGSHGGHYRGGRGSSHKGGRYKSAPTHDHYRKHR